MIFFIEKRGLNKNQVKIQKESVKKLVKIGKSERKIRKEFKEKQKQCIKYSQIKIKQ